MLMIESLNIIFNTQHGQVHAVHDINLSCQAGETLGIVGESGSGKSQTAMAIMGLLPRSARLSGHIVLDGQAIQHLSQREFNHIRSNKIAMIFQDPMTALNPYLKVSTQMTEVLTVHQGMRYQDALNVALAMLDAVKIPAPKKRIHMYPHEFSGGMRQRLMIAMALLCKPELLIADEPTTALDVTVQTQILKLLKSLQKDLNMALLLITHDMGVVAGMCDRVMVMYAGHVMEEADTDSIFYRPQHPYTQGLLKAMPRIDSDASRLHVIPGHPPNLRQSPVGCPFHGRCEHAHEPCYQRMPEMGQLNEQHQVACYWSQQDD